MDSNVARCESRVRRGQNRSPGTFVACAVAMILSVTATGCILPGREGTVPKSVINARQLSQRGIGAMERGEWSQAETLLSQATQACPADPEARRQYAEALWHRGAKPEALAQIEEAIKISNDDPQLHVRAGEMQLEMGKPSEALRCADEAIALDAKSASAWALHGRAIDKTSNAPRALADFQRALGYRHDDRQALLQTAEMYRQQGKPQRALVAIQSLLDTYGPGEEPQATLYLQGLALTALGRYDDAAESQLLALQRGPATAEIQYRLAEAHLLAGHLPEARLQAQKALALDARHPPSTALLERIQLAERTPPNWK